MSIKQPQEIRGREKADAPPHAQRQQMMVAGDNDLGIGLQRRF